MMFRRTCWLLALLLMLSGCRPAPPTPPAPPVQWQPAASDPGIKIESNDLLDGRDSESSSPLEPSREALSGTWEVRNGANVLTLLFLKPDDGRGPLSLSKDGTILLAWEGFGSIGSTSADIDFDKDKKQAVFYPGGSLNRSDLPFGPPQAFCTATLTSDKTLAVKGYVPGHILWRLNVTFVKVEGR
jgi:hypothetical protein